VSSPTGDALPGIAVLCGKLGILDTGDTRARSRETLFSWPTFGCQSFAVATVLSPGRFEVHDTIAAAVDHMRQLAQQPTRPRREAQSRSEPSNLAGVLYIPLQAAGHGWLFEENLRS
jgi:hypothetical protein